MSQINQILTRIATIQSQIVVTQQNGLPLVPFILDAEPYQPSDMSSVLLPAFINEIWAGKSNVPISAGQQYRTTRVKMMLAVQRKEAGINLRYSAQNTAAWVDAVYAMFAQHVRLSAPAILIKQSTNANPIQITTTVPHGLSPTFLPQVTIANHLVNTNANGTWSPTFVDYLNFTIPTAGNGVGAQTGTMRETQPTDLPNIVDAVIIGWNMVDYPYGSTVFLALAFELEVTEMYVTTIAG